jgi:hypothetical protein
MEVSDQLRAPAALRPREEPACLDVVTNMKNSWPCRETNPNRPARSSAMFSYASDLYPYQTEHMQLL